MDRSRNERAPTGARRWRIPATAAIAGAALLSACSNQLKVSGTFDEVWERTQEAMKTARFDTAGSGARHERAEEDRRNGVLKYVWSDGDFYDTTVVKLTISPVDDAPGAATVMAQDGEADAATADAATAGADRTIRIDAWSWGFFGWAQVSDPHATERAYNALKAAFDPEIPAEPIETAVQRARRQLPPGSPVYVPPAWPQHGHIASE